MFNKKGVSPLIATVLLIAFAVSLGAVVVNLGISVFSNPCTGRIVEVLTLDNSPRMCYVTSQKSLSLTVVNSGTVSTDGFKISVLGGDQSYNEDIPDKLGPFEKKVLSISLSAFTRVDMVTIVPWYDKKGTITYCSKNVKDYRPVRAC